MHVAGFSGVDVFFVISGFIIYQCSESFRANNSNYKSSLIFLLRRLLRIYPTYLIFFAATTFLTAAGIGKVISAVWDLNNLLSNMLLLNNHNTQVSVAWTLTFELYYYLIFSISLIFGKNHKEALFTWCIFQFLLVCVSSYVPSILSKFSYFEVWSNPLVLEFIIGCITAHIISKYPLSYKFSLIALCASILFFLAGGYICAQYEANHAFGELMPNWFFRVAFFGIAAALLLYSLVSLEIKGCIRTPNWLILYGDASYPMYLAQEILLRPILWISSRWATDLLILPAILTTVLLDIAIGLAVFTYFEKPLSKLFSRWLSLDARQI